MQRAHSFGKIRYISALRVRRSWTRNRINYREGERGERGVFITCRIARAAVSREARKKGCATAFFSIWILEYREARTTGSRRNDPKWRKNRNGWSELQGMRGEVRVKKKFRESLTDGAFSRNENIINRERGTCVRVCVCIFVQILPARQGCKIFPMAFSARWIPIISNIYFMGVIHFFGISRGWSRVPNA